MDKWLITNGEILNLKRVNRIFCDYCSDYDNWALWVVYNDELIKLCIGNEKKIKRRFKAIKDFLLSNESFAAEFMEIERVEYK